MLIPTKHSVRTGREWLTPATAAKLAKCARATILAAIRRGDIRAFCEQCHDSMSQAELAEGHGCSLGVGTRRSGGYRVVLRLADVQKYPIDVIHRASGLASARAKATRASARRRQ